MRLKHLLEELSGHAPGGCGDGQAACPKREGAAYREADAHGRCE
jgi:hypothetical protein